MEALKKNIWISFFSLFTSMGTLICCALPALLVSIGLGATMVGLVSTFPSLIWLSENKLLVFSASFFMLAISSYMQYRARFLPCPIDPEAARACTSARLWSTRITIFSIIVWIIGAAFAFLPLLLAKLEA
jgi:mercuric ion transport protein